MTAPFDVYFDNLRSVVQPDLFVVMNEQQQIIRKNGVHGVPELVIEIVSTNRAYDTQRKKALYEKAGVREYFIIDPVDKRVTLLPLAGSGAYDQAYEAFSLLKSALLNCKLSF